MRFDVKNKNGHYELYADGQFYGSYDTMNEAAKDIEELREKEVNRE